MERTPSFDITSWFKDGTPRLKGHQWTKVEDREKIWPMSTAREGVLPFESDLTQVTSHFDSGKTPWKDGVPLRWTLTGWWFRWVFPHTHTLSIWLLQRANGDGAKVLAMKNNCWTGLSIVETTANAATTMTTPGDWHANVTQDIRNTEYILVSVTLYQYLPCILCVCVFQTFIQD